MLHCSRAAHVDRPPDPTTDDERRAKLMGYAGGLQQVAIASTPLNVAPCRSIKSADRNPASRELAEGVVIGYQILTADEEFSRDDGRLSRENASLDQPVGRVAREKARMRVECVPAGRIVVDDATKARRELSEELVAGKPALAQERDLPIQAVDRRSSCRHA